MEEQKDCQTILKDFLIRFYHEEPDDLKAAIAALKGLRFSSKYELEVAQAIENGVRKPLPEGTLSELVRRYANRFVTSDEQAKRFIEDVYKNCGLDNAFDIDELTD